MQIICSHQVLFHRPTSQLGNAKNETVLVKAGHEIQTVPDWIADTDHFQSLEESGVIRQVEVKHRERAVTATVAPPEAPGLQGQADAAPRDAEATPDLPPGVVVTSAGPSKKK